MVMPAALVYTKLSQRWTGKISLACLGMAAMAVIFSCGSRDQVLEGILQRGFEKSDFYQNGNCSASPYWYDPEARSAQALKERWEKMGEPQAVWVKFRGDLSPIGRYGHLGQYLREVRANTIVEVKPSTGCKR